MKNQEFVSVLKECLSHRSATLNDRQLQEILSAQENLKELPTIGRAFHFIFDYVHFRMLYVDPEFTVMSGYGEEALLTDAYGFIHSLLHPDDRIPMVKIMRRINQHLLQSYSAESQVHVSFSYRLKKKDGSYLRLLHEWIETATDTHGRLIYSLERCTDITHWQENHPTVLMISQVGNQERIVYNPREEQVKVSSFTKAEMRVLKLLAEGMSSKQIADTLSITFNTVNTHRRKMLKKANVQNTTELIQTAYRQGIL